MCLGHAEAERRRPAGAGPGSLRGRQLKLRNDRPVIRSEVRADPLLSLAELYREKFDFVWRNLARLGVPDSALEDAVHDVFVVAHRRLPEFEGRSAPSTWLFAITYHVAQEHRRKHARQYRARC